MVGIIHSGNILIIHRFTALFIYIVLDWQSVLFTETNLILLFDNYKGLKSFRFDCILQTVLAHTRLSGSGVIIYVYCLSAVPGGTIKQKMLPIVIIIRILNAIA